MEIWKEEKGDQKKDTRSNANAIHKRERFTRLSEVRFDWLS
jgi:hypothetical protein